MTADRDFFGMRPVDGYQEQGAQAWLEGLDSDACPHAERTLASAEWHVGYAIEALMAVSSDPWEDDNLHFTDMMLHARADRGFATWHGRSLLPEADSVAQAIGLPCAEWPARCHEVATRMLASGLLSPLEADHGLPRVCYGIYEGPVAQVSLFAGKSVIRHGWVEYPSGLVVDPTRWVFQCSPPSLWCGSSEHYDLGMRRLRMRVAARPMPRFDAGDVGVRLASNDPDVAAALARALQDTELPARMGMTRTQAFWLANCPPEAFGEDARIVFRELVRMGMGGLVPMDTRAELEHAGPGTAEHAPSSPVSRTP